VIGNFFRDYQETQVEKDKTVCQEKWDPRDHKEMLDLKEMLDTQ
jgi:hypothetical protein